MENKLKLEVITPYGELINEDVDEVYTTGAEGDFGVLPGHCPFLTAIRIGSLSYKRKDRLIIFLLIEDIVKY